MFAIVNDKNSTQIDSAKTFISELGPHETIGFTFLPDSAIKDKVYFYSCVGGNVDDMKINEYEIVNLSPSKVLGYKFSDLIQIDSMNYNKSSHELNFIVNNIYPYPGSLSLELMPIQTKNVSVEMDGQTLQSTSIKNGENKTKIELSIPLGIHEVVVSNLED